MFSLQFIEDARTCTRTVHGHMRISRHPYTLVPARTIAQTHPPACTHTCATHTCTYSHPRTLIFLHFHTRTHSHALKLACTHTHGLTHSLTLIRTLARLHICKRTLTLTRIPIHTRTPAHADIRSCTQYCTLVHSHARTVLWVSSRCLFIFSYVFVSYLTLLWVTSLYLLSFHMYLQNTVDYLTLPIRYLKFSILWVPHSASLPSNCNTKKVLQRLSASISRVVWATIKMHLKY